MANPGSIVDYEGNRAIVGDRVELHAATDWWMRGARYGIITRIKQRADGQPTAVIRLDNYSRRAIHFLGRDFRRITTRQMNPGKRRTAHRVKKAFRKRARNPTRNVYKMTAQRRGGKLLTLVQGNKFAVRGKPVRFADHGSAWATAKWLQNQYPTLRHYTILVTTR